MKSGMTIRVARFLEWQKEWKTCAEIAQALGASFYSVSPAIGWLSRANFCRYRVMDNGQAGWKMSDGRTAADLEALRNDAFLARRDRLDAKRQAAKKERDAHGQSQVNSYTRDAKETIQKLKKRIIELEARIERMQREREQVETNPFGFYALDIDMRRKLQGRPSRHVNL